MPKGPHGESRPADTVASAIKVAKIATGDMADDRRSSTGRSKGSSAGGEARAAALSGSERREIAKKAADAKWRKERRRVMNSSDNACDQLAALYRKKQAEGLIDVKFFVSGVKDVAKEVVCAEALRFDEAVERGDTLPLDFDDRHDRS